mmetsp:Transcript_18754/g.45973  ORF Transcript_18754/g.45973 Transcript_18754/m.45973 type:complete len:421 (-) Transcript_18754:126-1388(-)
MEENFESPPRQQRTDVKAGGSRSFTASETKSNEKKERDNLFGVERAMSEANFFGRVQFRRGQLTRGFSMTQSMYSGMPPIHGSTNRNPVFRNCEMEPTVWRSVSLGPDIGRRFANAPEIQKLVHHKLQARKAIKKPPHPPGGYLEMATTFDTATDPEKIIVRIKSILTTMEIDFIEDLENYQFKCEVYPHGRRLTFDVRVFSQASKYAVEVHRRKGDSLAFSHMYKKFLRKCAESTLCSLDLCPPLSNTFAEDEEELFAEMDQNTIASTLKSVFEMAAAEFIDTKINAAATLSELSKGKAIVDWFAAKVDAHLEILKELLDHDAIDIHRAAACSTANFAAVRKDICEIFNKFGFVASLVKLLNSTNMQVTREASRALKNMGTFLGKDMKLEPKEIFCLLKSKDAYIRQNGIDLQQSLRFA